MNTRDIGMRRIGRVTAGLAAASVAGTLAVAGLVGFSRTAGTSSTTAPVGGSTSQDDGNAQSDDSQDDGSGALGGGSVAPNLGGGAPALTGGGGPGHAMSGGS